MGATVKAHLVAPIMYVCVCHAITDRQLKEVVGRGAASLDEVQAHLPIASCCGCCEETARDVIDSLARREQKPVAA